MVTEDNMEDDMCNYSLHQLLNQKNILMGKDVQYDMIIDSYYGDDWRWVMIRAMQDTV